MDSGCIHKIELTKLHDGTLDEGCERKRGIRNRNPQSPEKEERIGKVRLEPGELVGFPRSQGRHQGFIKNSIVKNVCQVLLRSPAK